MRTLLLASCIALSACSANQVMQAAPVVGSVCTAAQKTLIDDKIVYGAEALYNVPAQAYVVADKAKQLTPELKAQLKPLLIKMDELRRAIYAGRGAANCDYSQLKELHMRVVQLLPRR